MDIKILSYIDHKNLQAVPGSEKPASSNRAKADKGGTEGGFKTTLATAQRTMEALAIDLITSQDDETIQKTAEILSKSGNSRLQQLGQSLAAPDPDKKTSSENKADSDVSPAAPVREDSADSTKTPSAKTDSADSTKTSSAKTGSSDSAAASDDAAKASSVLNCPSSLEKYFTDAAEKYDVDVALLEAIAKAESNFSANAKSSAGAIGVMQLMPATASSLGVSNSYDARSNIMGGAKLISQLLDKYDGDISLALAAYNAGSGNVAKYGGIPPFTETQNYVKKVTKYYEQASA